MCATCWTTADADRLRPLAQQVVREDGVVALLAVLGPPVQIVAARADDVPADMGQLLDGILADLQAATGESPSGGGGGRFAQGGGVTVPPAVLASALDAAVDRLLGVDRGWLTRVGPPAPHNETPAAAGCTGA